MEEILAVLQTIQQDKNKLEHLHQFMMDEIYEETEQKGIPKSYKKLISEIAENLLIGFICFFNPKTLEVEFLPKKLIEDPKEYEMITGESYKNMELEHKSWEKCIEIEPIESYDSFKVMEYFIDEIDDVYLQNKLRDALNKSKPFANFKNIVESSKFRQQWFDFRQKQLEFYVWDILKAKSDL